MLDFNRMGSQTPQGGSILDLDKTSILDLVKDDKSLNKILIGLGWDIAEGLGDSYDLDLAAFLVGADGKIHSDQIKQRVVYFKNKGDVKTIGVQLEEDNRTGAGEGDDEKMHIELANVSPDVQEIVILATIYDAEKRHQTFSKVNNSYVRLINEDEKNEVVCRYSLKEECKTETFMYFGKLYRDGNIWKFTPIGEGGIGSLETALMKYYAQ